MSGWPRLVFVRGVGIQVHSWEELDEILRRYGSSVGQPRDDRRLMDLTEEDRSRLQLLLDAGPSGVPTKILSDRFGKRGKALYPALENWALRVGLRHEAQAVFQGVRNAQGRGFRFKERFFRRAYLMLNAYETPRAENKDTDTRGGTL